MIADIKEILLSEEEIKNRVRELGEEISRDFAGKDLLIVSVLKGSFIFMADLVRNISIPCTIDFMALSSYGKGTTTTGEVRILKDLGEAIDGKHLLIVEDILDSGVTLSYTMKILAARGPASITLCTLLDKPDRRKVPVDIKYSGFKITNNFVVGYGLDYDERHRNLPYIGLLKPEVYGG